MTKAIKVSEMTETERRIDAATAATFTGTEFDRRHECEALPTAAVCKHCGRPMTETETHVYRAL